MQRVSSATHLEEQPHVELKFDIYMGKGTRLSDVSHIEDKGLDLPKHWPAFNHGYNWA